MSLTLWSLSSSHPPVPALAALWVEISCFSRQEPLAWGMETGNFNLFSMTFKGSELQHTGNEYPVLEIKWKKVVRAFPLVNLIPKHVPNKFETYFSLVFFVCLGDAQWNHAEWWRFLVSPNLVSLSMVKCLYLSTDFPHCEHGLSPFCSQMEGGIQASGFCLPVTRNMQKQAMSFHSNYTCFLLLTGFCIPS